MKKNTWLAMVFLTVAIFCATGAAQATIIQGIATADGDTQRVGDWHGNWIDMFIPVIDEPIGVSGNGTYGVDDSTVDTSRTENYGTVPDSNRFGNSPSLSQPFRFPKMDMYIYFDIPDGEVGKEVVFVFEDLDLRPKNSPSHSTYPVWPGEDGDSEYWEKITFHGEWGLPNGTFGNSNVLGSEPNVQVSVQQQETILSDGSKIYDPYTTMLITGLNVTTDGWMKLSFQGFVFDDRVNPAGWMWGNTVESFKVNLHTDPVPEPSTVLLLGGGLLALLAVRRRRD